MKGRVNISQNLCRLTGHLKIKERLLTTSKDFYTIDVSHRVKVPYFYANILEFLIFPG